MLCRCEVTQEELNQYPMISQITVLLTRHKIVIDVSVDPEPVNPREYQNIARLILFGERNPMGDRHDFPSPKYFMEWLESTDPQLRRHHVRTVFFGSYHIWTESLGRSRGDLPDGYIFVNLEDLYRQNGGLRPFSSLRKQERDKLIRQADEVIQSEVQIYNLFLEGSVYSFYLECFDVYGSMVDRKCILQDGCGGFYGWEDLSRAIYESMYSILKQLGYGSEDISSIITTLGAKTDLEPAEVVMRYARG